MQKVLYSLLVIGIVSSIVVGSGAMAYFNDVETSTDNTFTAGTLDLNADGKDTGTTTVTTVNVSNKVPGDSGSGATTLKNNGSIAGELDINMSAITETAGTIGEYSGGKDLASNLKMVLWMDANQNEQFDDGDIELKNNNETRVLFDSVATSLDYVIANTYEGDSWDAVKTTMASGDLQDFTISWRIPSGVGNAIQGDSMSFDVTFTLEQAAED